MWQFSQYLPTRNAGVMLTGGFSFGRTLQSCMINAAPTLVRVNIPQSHIYPNHIPMGHGPPPTVSSEGSRLSA